MTTPTRNYSKITCACGHTETINPDRMYKVIPTGRYRWVVDPDTSTVGMEDEMTYICDPCWEELPDE